MKLALRFFALGLVLAGAAAATVSSHPAHASAQAVSAALPVPVCSPSIPTCNLKPQGGN